MAWKWTGHLACWEPCFELVQCIKGTICDRISQLDVVVLQPALCMSSTASGVVSTESPMSKQKYNGYNWTITVWWTISSEEVR